MAILAFDTCLGSCSAALIERELRAGAPPGRVLAALSERMETGHAERLMPMIEELLRGAGLVVRDLTGFAVTVGPGTFTGVRLGIAAVRGLALPYPRPIMVTTSLALLAAAATGAALAGPSMVLSVADARNGHVMAGLFAITAAGLIQPLEPPRLLTVVDAAALVTADRIVAGNAAAAVAAAAVCQPAGQRGELEPDASEFTRVAWEPADPPLPLYARPPDAKPQSGKTLPRAAS